MWRSLVPIFKAYDAFGCPAVFLPLFCWKCVIEMEEISAHLDSRNQSRRHHSRCVSERHDRILLSTLHDSSTCYTSTWRQYSLTVVTFFILSHLALPFEPFSVSLLVPVVMDCFIDGFLIGVTCALSPKGEFFVIESITPFKLLNNSCSHNWISMFFYWNGDLICLQRLNLN